MLALFFLFITVVYNYSFARLIFVSGLDRRLPAVMSHVNKAKVPDVAIWVQTVIASVFTLVAFVLVPSLVGKPVNAETQIYDVLQAAVTVIWCISIAVLFIDVRRPGLVVGIVATLSGSWTPLISNDAGHLKIFGAVIQYGTWFWWVGGITLVSLAIASLLYVIGGRSATPRRRGLHAASPAR